MKALLSAKEGTTLIIERLKVLLHFNEPAKSLYNFSLLLLVTT